MTLAAPPKAVIFDLYGTLVEEYHPAAFTALLQGIHAQCAADPELHPLHALPFEQFAGIMQDIYARWYKTAAVTTAESPDPRGAIAEAIQLSGCPAPKPDAIERFIGYYSQAHVMRPLATALPVLDALLAQGIACALLSNVFFPGWVHERQLQEHGLADRLAVRYLSSDQRYMKPHPRAYEQVLAELDRTPAECVMVGDLVHTDIIGARRIGMPAALIAETPPADIGDATWVIPRLEALLDLW